MIGGTGGYTVLHTSLEYPLAIEPKYVHLGLTVLQLLQTTFRGGFLSRTKIIA